MSQTPACPDVPALPCPFCGGPVVTFTQNGSGYQISCEAACAETPWYETVDDAKAWWNTRALPSTALAARPEEGDRPAYGENDWSAGYDEGYREGYNEAYGIYGKPAPSTPPTAGDGHD